MPAIVCIGHLFLSVIASGLLRTWVYASAWRGYSRTRIRKMRRARSLAVRLTLMYLFTQDASRETKKRIFLYWLYIAMVLLGAILLLFSARSVAMHTAAGFVFFLIRSIELAAWILWGIYGRPHY